MTYGGCGGSLKPTRLSLQFAELQGDFAKLQGQCHFIPAESPRISMRWIGLSLFKEQGNHHSIAGKVDLETPESSVFFGDISLRLRLVR
jgi:hypothetical protein